MTPSIYSNMEFIIKGLLNKDPFVFRQVIAGFLSASIYSRYDLDLPSDQLDKIVDCLLIRHGIDVTKLPDTKINEVCEEIINKDFNLSDAEFLEALGITIKEEKKQNE